jgi:hypothetical protein
MNILRLLGTIFPNLFKNTNLTSRALGMNVKWAALALVFPLQLLVADGIGHQHLPTREELVQGKSLYGACTNDFPTEPYGEAVCISYLEGLTDGHSLAAEGLCVENVWIFRHGMNKTLVRPNPAETQPAFPLSPGPHPPSHFPQCPIIKRFSIPSTALLLMQTRSCGKPLTS